MSEMKRMRRGSCELRYRYCRLPLTPVSNIPERGTSVGIVQYRTARNDDNDRRSMLRCLRNIL